jgi:hypothetical protein
MAAEPSVLEPNDPLAVTGVRFRMCHLDDSGAERIELTKQFHDFFRLIGMQIASRLVRQKEFMFRYRRSHHGDKLLLATGELSRKEIAFSDDVESI